MKKTTDLNTAHCLLLNGSISAKGVQFGMKNGHTALPPLPGAGLIGTIFSMVRS
jgi:hypothetical protein